MKDFVRKMEKVNIDGFYIDGKKWTLKKGIKNQGTSPRGLWNVMTDGEKTLTIYKADILKFDKEKAISLFNGKAKEA